MLLFFLSYFVSGVSSQALEPFSPPSLPLAVKSPYVNFWLPQGPNPGKISNAWPKAWNNPTDAIVSLTFIQSTRDT